MDLTWNEMRDRATMFATQWRDEQRERAEKDTFWNEFFAIFGISRRRVAVFEQLSDRHSTGGRGFMDVFWPQYVAAEHKSRGSDLTKAMEQALDYLPGLPEEHLPRLVVVCDFGRFYVRDMETREDYRFTIDELPGRLDVFGFLAGRDSRRVYETEEDVNLDATTLLAELHDALQASGYGGHPLRVLLVRLLFVLFADDTRVWERGRFHDYLTLRTRLDGADLGPALAHLFQVLNTPRNERPNTLSEELSDFEYINGGLFAESLPIPACNRPMRERLLACAQFDWSKINPAIFGSLFQNVMTPLERRSLGAHYTTEANILRTIEPLLLTQLRQELEDARTVPALQRYQDKLASLRFFDPACGCGNFLIITYREIRRLELECLLRIRQRQHDVDQLALDVLLRSKVTVGQFFGIELEEFPARIAETAMYLMDHLQNLELSAALGEYYARFPIADTAHIAVGNALRMDWRSVLLPDQCDYVLGNPPFSGQYTRSEGQTADLKHVWGDEYSGYLDYVTGWYAKARDYATEHTKVALVSTNSICQGEPVAPLWGSLFSRGFHIDFAYRTFTWASEARGRAGVHVVIVGFSRGVAPKERLLFDPTVSGATPRKVRNINAYLLDGPDILVRPRNRPLSRDLPRLRYGSKVADGGHLLVDKTQFGVVSADPHAAKYLRRFIGARELIHGEARWCLWMVDLDPDDVRESQILRDRIDAVRAMREASKDREIVQAAARPAEFLRILQPDADYLAIPAHVGESRRHFPVGYFSPNVITGNHNFVAEDPDGYLFGLLSSSMFISWMRAVSGRIRSDLRFSKTLTWHNFPLPDASPPKRLRVMKAGREVLAARALWPDRSLAQLYDSRAMPGPLVSAHHELDRAVDALYGRMRLRSDSDRLALLFERYAALLGGQELTIDAPRQSGR